MLENFLSSVNGFIQSRNADELSNYISIEPDQQGNFGDAYTSLIQNVRSNFPQDNDNALEAFCSQRLPFAQAGEDDMPWLDFVRFMVSYLKYLTLVNPQDLLQTYNLLSDVVQ